ncbi:hypothetical protein K8I31_12665, partial [bacterium]|nr:hypothetical protein [bacterium]
QYTVLRSFPLNVSDQFAIVQIHPDLNIPANGYSLRLDNRLYRAVHTIGLFESPSEGWDYSGAAMQNQPTPMELGLFPTVTGFLGTGLLHTGMNESSGGMIGSATSPQFVPSENQQLIFTVGGSDSPSVGVQLMDASSVIGEWRGDGSTHLNEVNVDLSPYAAKPLHLRVFDEDERPGECILFDHAMVLETQ